MQIPPSVLNTTSMRVSPVRFGGTGTLLAHNLGRVRKDFFHNLQNDTVSLQNNALIYASLILVVSRMVAAAKGAIKAKGTSDENYRKSEAFKTCLREVGGFSFSFLVLRVFQRMIGNQIAKFFGLKRYGSLFQYTSKHFSEAIAWTFIKRQPLHTRQRFLAPGLRYPKDKIGLERMVEYYEGLGLDRLFKIKVLGVTGQAKEAQVFRNIVTLHKYIPIILASIPAVICSGFFLENFTQKHANGIAKKAETWLDNQDKQQAYDIHHSKF